MASVQHSLRKSAAYLCPINSFLSTVSFSGSQLPRAPMTKPSTSTLRKPLDFRRKRLYVIIFVLFGLACRLECHFTEALSNHICPLWPCVPLGMPFHPEMGPSHGQRMPLTWALLGISRSGLRTILSPGTTCSRSCVPHEGWYCLGETMEDLVVSVPY